MKRIDLSRMIAKKKYDPLQGRVTHCDFDATNMQPRSVNYN